PSRVSQSSFENSSSSKNKTAKYSWLFQWRSRKQCGVLSSPEPRSTRRRSPTSRSGNGLSGRCGPFHCGGQLRRPRHLIRGCLRSSTVTLHLRNYYCNHFHLDSEKYYNL